MPVDTAKSSDRRSIHFTSIPELRKDLDRLAAAHAKSTLRTSGNWTPGQIYSHLAAFINYAYDGYPADLANPPWIIRFILKFRKNSWLNGSLPAGVKIPKIKNGTVGMEDIPADQALARFRTALDRLEQSPPSKPNPIFGPMTHEEWTKMHLRHAELHLSFLHP